MAKDDKLNKELRNLYHASPIVWAVVKGSHTPEVIAEALGKSLGSIRRGIIACRQAGMIREEESRLMPGLPYHRGLHRQLFPERVPQITSPLLDALSAEPLSTQQVADQVGRSYHSTYRSLQRWQTKGFVAREGKLWRRA